MWLSDGIFLRKYFCTDMDQSVVFYMQGHIIASEVPMGAGNPCLCKLKEMHLI